MTSDLLHAWRLFSRRPLFTSAVVGLLALGIGANTAIFSLVQAVLLRPLPYHDPGRLAFVTNERTGQPLLHDRHGVWTGTHVTGMLAQAQVFESIAVIDGWTTNLAPLMDLVHAGGAERLRGAFVTPNFFELLGVRAAAGRTLESRDGASGATPVVLGDGFWRRRFGADPAIVGQHLDIVLGVGRQRAAPTRCVVVGVLPPAFRFTYPLETEIWTVLPWTRIRPDNALLYQIVGRLRPGMTVEQAQARLTPVVQEIGRGYGLPERFVRDQVALVETVPEHVADAVRPGVRLLVAGAGVVLLIGCVNVALLLLALISDRQREVAVRGALGAAPSRILRQLLVESALLATAGGALGAAVAWLLVPVLRGLVPPIVPRGDEIVVDGAVLVFALASAAGTALVCGIAPAWHARLKDVYGPLRQAGANATAASRLIGWRRAVVAVQVAVVFVLLIGAALLLHSFWRMQQVDLGFDSRGLLTMEMRLLSPKYREPGRMAAFQRDVLERVRSLPGVERASMTSAVPLRGVDFFYSVEPAGGGASKGGHMRPVDPEYFDLMRIPILAGRGFTSADTGDAGDVVILSQAFAQALFGDVNPIGRRVNVGRGETEIVGIAGDVRHASVKRAAFPALYVPRAQRPSELICLVVRPGPGATGVAAAVIEAARSVDPGQPVQNVATLDSVVRESTAEERFYTVTTAGFAAVAIVLALAGLAGVVARTVTERRRETAIRLALGAAPWQLVARSMRQGLAPVAVGLAAGLAGAWAGSRLLDHFLFEVSSSDAATYAAAALLLAACAVLACYLPARRTLRIEPMTILREL